MHTAIQNLTHGVDAGQHHQRQHGQTVEQHQHTIDTRQNRQTLGIGIQTDNVQLVGHQISHDGGLGTIGNVDNVVRGSPILGIRMCARHIHAAAALPRIPGACGRIVVSEHDFPPRGVISRYHPNRGFAKLRSIKTV